MSAHILTVFIKFLEDFDEFFWRKFRIAFKFKHTTFNACHVPCPQDQNNIRIEWEPAFIIIYEFNACALRALGALADNIQIYVWERKTGVMNEANKNLEGRRIKQNYEAFRRISWLGLFYLMATVRIPRNQEEIYTEKSIGYRQYGFRKDMLEKGKR